MTTNETTAQHTPGPWHVDSRPVRGEAASISASGSKPGTRLMIAGCHDVDGYSGNTAANARLIAAAPGMLGALETARTALDNMRNARRLGWEYDEATAWKDADAAIDAAIRAARGEE